MGEYYRRDRYDGNDRRYSREDSHQRPLDYHSERGGREERYPPPRSRSRERAYQDRDREEDYSYRRDRDRDRHYDYSPPPTSPQPTTTITTDHDIDHPPRAPRFDRGKPPQQHYPEDSYDAGKPNAQVIFRGLDKEITETDVYKHFHTFRTITNIHSYNNFFTFNKTLPLKV